MGLTRAEQETVIRWDEGEKVVHVYSASPVTWRRLARLGLTPIRETRHEGEVTGRFYTLPLARFRWGLKATGRPGNPAALAAAREARRRLSNDRDSGAAVAFPGS